ncbi:hypothetical protein ES332_A02G071500v1 [Gossypium tomentosum]|uniref:Knottin scorpion toxin-like domain-containing protein n=1 Tax=Gossypium tomentosum TaxID=34277 RepID=A0A5D2RGS8_GOSTO|nr:hypothetical protein ES332_A02G071500v1 [Gossypium tomentosum]
MVILELFFTFLMLMIYLTSVTADTQIYIDRPMYVEGGKPTAKSDAKLKCCNNHPKLGKCIPGEDDNPDKDGKCWNYCIADCERGGVCKLMSGGHHECHCAC